MEPKAGVEGERMQYFFIKAEIHIRRMQVKEGSTERCPICILIYFIKFILFHVEMY